MNKSDVMRAIARKIPWKLAEVKSIRIEYMISDGKPRILELLSEPKDHALAVTEEDLNVSYDVEDI